MKGSSPSHYRKSGSTTQLAVPPQPLQRPEDWALPDSQSGTRVDATRIPEHYWRVPKDTLTYINGVPMRQADTDTIFPSSEPRTEAERLWLYNFSSDVLSNVTGRASYLNLNKEGDIRFVLHGINLLQIFCFEISRHVACITLDKQTYPYEKLATLLVSISSALQGLNENLTQYAAHEASHAPLLSDLSNFYRYTSPGTDITNLYADVRSTTTIETETSLALITDLERRLNDEKESAQKRETELEQRIKSLESELAAQKKNSSRLELELSATKTIRTNIISTHSLGKSHNTTTNNLIQGSSALGLSSEDSLTDLKSRAARKPNNLDTDMITTNVYSSFSPAPMTQTSSSIRLLPQNVIDIYENISTMSVQRNQPHGEGAILQRISEMPVSHNLIGQQTLGDGADYTVLRSYTGGSQRMLDRFGKRTAELDHVENVPTTLEVSNCRDSNRIELHSRMIDPSQRSSAIFQTIGNLMSTQTTGPHHILNRPQTAPEPEYSSLTYRNTQEIGPANNSSIDIIKLQRKGWADTAMRDIRGRASDKLDNSSRQQEILDPTTTFILPKGLANAASKFLGAITSLDEDDAWRLEANLTRQMTKNTLDTPLLGNHNKDFGNILLRQSNDNQAFSLLNPICMPHERAIGEIDLSADSFRITFRAVPEAISGQKALFTKQITQDWTDDYLKQYMRDINLTNTGTHLSRPPLLNNHSNSLPTVSLSSTVPDNLIESKIIEPQHTLSQPLKSAVGRRIPILSKSRCMNPEVRPKTSLKTGKISKRASTSTSPTRHNLSTDPVVEAETDTLLPNQSENDFIDEADAFQGMIALGEKDMSPTLTDPSAHAVTCRTLYSKTRAELYAIYRHIYFLRNTSNDTSIIDRSSEEKILLQPRYITQYTKIVDALLQTENGLQSIPFIKGSSYLESQYGQSDQKKESIMLLTRKLFCSDSIFSFTTNDNIFQALNERIATVPQQELRDALWCDFFSQWSALANGITGQETKQTALLSKCLESMCRKWDIMPLIKLILCYKFDLHTLIRLSDLTLFKTANTNGSSSVIQMFTHPGFFSGASKTYFMGLSKATHLYKILKPFLRTFCAKLDSVASKTATHANVKSTTQARISVEERKGLMHLKSIVSNIGYVLLDLRTVLGIIHELIVQRHASYKLSIHRNSSYNPMDRFLLEVFMHQNSLDIDRAHRALISFLLSIQVYILCDHLSDDFGVECSDEDNQLDSLWPISRHSPTRPLSVVPHVGAVHQPGENGDIDENETSLFDDPVLDDAPVKLRSASEATGIFQCNEFLLIFLEMLSSSDHLTTEYLCYSYIALHEYSGAKYPYPFIGLDSVLLLVRKLLPELPGPYLALLDSSLKQLAITDRCDAPVLNIGTVLRILGSQKRMVRLMLINTVAEEYGHLLTKETIPQAGPSLEDIPRSIESGDKTIPDVTSSMLVGGRRDQAKKPKSSIKQKRESKSIDELKTSWYLDIPITYENFTRVISKTGCTLFPAMTAKYYYAAMWSATIDKTEPTSTRQSTSGLGLEFATHTNSSMPSLRRIFSILPYVAYESFPYLFNVLSRKSKLFSTQRLYYGHELSAQHDIQALVLRYALCGDRYGYIQELRGTLKTIVYELEAPVKRLVSMLTCEANGLAYNMEPFYISAHLSGSTNNSISPTYSSEVAKCSTSSLSYTMPVRRHLSVMAMQLTALYASAKLTIGDNSLSDDALVDVISTIRELNSQMHISYQSLRPFNSSITGLLYELQDRLQGIVRCDSYLCKNVTTEEMLRETLGVDNINGPLARVLGMARNSIHIQ
ncbi:Hypothetical protein GLP15_4197 [Giardia lamblia P15]|uniref:Uncharacterized protein n=1 Tax=Giardia intestinalis (strain P15) TaxID=658858 RepID=E1F0J6_GIAIA|nr:Hypothetical protein GLP15_4197 [Giardia lamblia P15]